MSEDNKDVKKEETIVETVKKTATEVKETATEVKETAEKVVDEVKNVIATTKSKTWWNRIWSAIIGAIVAIAAMFGIETAEIKSQADNTAEIKVILNETLTAVKAGDMVTATAKLNEAAVKLNEASEEAKTLFDKVKAKINEMKSDNAESANNAATADKVADDSAITK